jgi:hypothetical protein
MNFLDFLEWYEIKYEENWEYIKNKNNYGFRLIFFKESTCFKNNIIYPEYPWKENFKNEIISQNQKNIFFNNELIILKRENENLKNENENLKKK